MNGLKSQGPDGAFNAYVARPSGTPKARGGGDPGDFRRQRRDARQGRLAGARRLPGDRAGSVLAHQAGHRAHRPNRRRVEASDRLHEPARQERQRSRRAGDADARARHGRRARPACLGYCMGGYIAFLAACRTDTDASVAYHGGGIHTALGEAGGDQEAGDAAQPDEGQLHPGRSAQHHPRDAEAPIRW